MVRREPRPRQQRAPRVPRRRRARLGRPPTWRSAASRRCPRASSPASARASSTPRRSPRWPPSSGSASSCKLGKGEAAAGGAGKPSILADALEAVIGAVYLDGGRRRGLRVRRTAARRTASGRRRRPPPRARLQVARCRSCSAALGRAGAGVRRQSEQGPTTTSGSSPRVRRRWRGARSRGEGRSKKRRRAGRGRVAPSRSGRGPLDRLTAPCPSSPRSRPSGAGWPARRRPAHRARRGRPARTVRRTSAQAVDRRAHRHDGRGRRPPRQVPAVPARHRRRADGPPAHDRPAAARRAGCRRARRTPTWCSTSPPASAAGDAARAVVRRPAHVRRGRRVRPRPRRRSRSPSWPARASTRSSTSSTSTRSAGLLRGAGDRSSRCCSTST